jgi:hypothetical protein
MRKLSVAILAGAQFAPLPGNGQYLAFSMLEQQPETLGVYDQKIVKLEGAAGGRSPKSGVSDFELGSCPLGAAFLGSLYGEADRSKFYKLCQNSSQESITDFITIGLNKAFPELGSRASTLGNMVPILRRDIPELVSIDSRTGKRRDPSLFQIVTSLDRIRWSKKEISQFLGRQGL